VVGSRYVGQVVVVVVLELGKVEAVVNEEEEVVVMVVV
jgi:hypothetical protein